MHHTLGGGGGSFSWIFFPFIQKKKKRKPLLFSWPRIPFLTAGVERAAAPVGWGLLWPHTWGGGSSSSEVPELPYARDPWHISPWAWGLGGPPAGSWGQSGLGGLCVASGRPGSPPLLPGELPVSPHSIPNSSAPEDGRRFIAPVTRAHGRGWRVRGEGGGHVPGTQGPGESFLWPECWDIHFS